MRVPSNCTGKLLITFGGLIMVLTAFVHHSGICPNFAELLEQGAQKTKSWATMAREKLRSSSWLACAPRRLRDQLLMIISPLPAASGVSRIKQTVLWQQHPTRATGAESSAKKQAAGMVAPWTGAPACAPT